MTNLATLLFGDVAKRANDGCGVSEPDERTVVAWINSHPPVPPKDKNHCAACGEYIEVYNTNWVYLGDGALIHYSGKYGKVCWDQWQEMRRDEANSALGLPKGA
jgi:hypothetical protein